MMRDGRFVTDDTDHLRNFASDFLKIKIRIKIYQMLCTFQVNFVTTSSIDTNTSSHKNGFFY